MILLDTHAWLWMLHDPSQLSEEARRLIAIEEVQNGLLISSISVWEIAVKVSIGKLSLPLPIEDWYGQARMHSGTVVEPLNPLDAIASSLLPEPFHKDPADRILVAIARRYDIPLVSCDQKILAYSHVNAVW
jgi:PIN domain nuclease of toxin-antitoxin system